MKRLLFFLSITCFISRIGAQCDTTNVNGNLTISFPQFLSGTIIVSGTFHVPAGVTLYVEPYSFGGCGKLEIHAQNIIIDGTIDGNFAGYNGGTGGLGGSTVNSLTGDQTALSNCSNKDNSGQITVDGGYSGTIGVGPGSGLSGGQGADGSGPKQQCQNNGDEAGLIGSGGGAGGGGGGSYGGTGTIASYGGDGSDYYVANSLAVSPAFVVVKGLGGSGGINGATYGSQFGLDIDAGSGGAGSGGGGRSYNQGLQGGNGGAGGGMIALYATDTLIVAGNAVITANGEAGQIGGIGGDGGASTKCCSDGCDDCGETTLSCGSGGGSGAGGGSGGGILLHTNGYSLIGGVFNARGGNGGSGGNGGQGSNCTYTNTFCTDNDINSGGGQNGNSGGAGGGGRIKVFVSQNCGSVSAVMNSSGGTGANGNGATGTAEVICTTTVEEESASEFTAFPNPVTTEITLAFGSFPVNEIRVVITDISGRVVYDQVNNASGNLLVINTEFLSTGMYFCTAQSETFSGTLNFIRK